MSDTPKVHVRYVGNGKQFFIGVPARDLTKEEFDRLDPNERRDVESSDLYSFVKSPSKSNAPAVTESENN